MVGHNCANYLIKKLGYDLKCNYAKINIPLYIKCKIKVYSPNFYFTYKMQKQTVKLARLLHNVFKTIFTSKLFHRSVLYFREHDVLKIDLISLFICNKKFYC